MLGIRSAQRRSFQSLIVAIAMVVGLFASAGTRAEAADPVTVTSTLPVNGSAVSVLDHLELQTIVQVGYTLTQANFVIQRISDGRYWNGLNEAWEATRGGGIVMYDTDMAQGLFKVDFDTHILNALSQDGEYDIHYEIRYTDGTSDYTTEHTTRITLDRTAPVVAEGSMSGNGAAVVFSEPFWSGEEGVEPPEVTASDFVLKIDDVPATIVYVSAIIGEPRGLIIVTQSSISYGQKITFQRTAGSTVFQDRAGNLLSPSEFELTNGMPEPSSPFQSTPVMNVKMKSGYALKPNDPILTFTPSRNSAYILQIGLPSAAGNVPILNSSSIRYTDFKLINNTDGVSLTPQNNSLVIGSDMLQFVFDHNFETGKSYTLTMSGTAGGDEIKLPANETSNASAFIAILDGNLIPVNNYSFIGLTLTAMDKTPTPDTSDVRIINNRDGADVLFVDHVPAGGVVKVYDAPTSGSEIGRGTSAIAGGTVRIDILNGIAASNAYVTVTDETGEKSESDRLSVAMPAPIEKAALINAINSAETLFVASVEGGANGQYPIGSKADLLTAINEAIYVKQNLIASQIEVNNAITSLNAEVTAFESKLIHVNLTALQTAVNTAQDKHDAATEGQANGQYPGGSKATLQNAIDAAGGVLDDPLASQSDVDSALAALNAAVSAFSAKQVVLGPIGGSNGAPHVTTIIELEVTGNGTVLGKLPLTRTIDAGGRASDRLELSKDRLAEWADRLKGSGELSLTIPDTESIVDETKVTIPADVVLLLAERGLSLRLNVNGVSLAIPASSWKDVKGPIELNFAPVRSKGKQDELAKRADGNVGVRNKAGHGALRIIGVPVDIGTNLQDRPVTITLPATSESDRSELGIYVDHSDGTTEWILPRSVSSGLTFDVSKFSTFAVVKVDGMQAYRDAQSSAKQTPYLAGYADGTFKPNATITRAELASILAKVIPGEGTNSVTVFKDVPAMNWAKEAISKVAKLGLMRGEPDGSFNPNKPVTRAEIAMIAAAIVNRGANSAEVNNGNGFKDISGHWAEASILTAQASGIMSGFQDGSFRPGQALSRAEAVVIINRIIGRKPVLSGMPSYKDVPASHWAYGAIQAASAPVLE
ncbi:S-layer homology domain-containing protein [Cohnella soli]|uniref:S-layer homology domain-containing protein n=1 Tax=Cohnella soli TaxID=425005 RepID=A0ABW0HQE7_9BACL